MHPLLNSLYEEYEDLTEKRNLVRSLILKYGGDIPDEGSPTMVTLPRDVSDDEAYEFIYYDKNATWKEKVISVLEYHKLPMTTKEISQFLHPQELKHNPDMDYIHVHNMVTQMASAMGRAGEIGVDDTNFRNKYFIKPSGEKI